MSEQGVPIEFGKAQFIRSSPVPELELVSVFAATILPRDASQLMSVLTSAAPLGRLSHLKRIRKRETDNSMELSIILCRNESHGATDLPEQVALIAEKHNLQHYTAQVAGNMPTSRELWKEWSLYWPISWRPPEPHLSCDILQVSDEFQEKFQAHMRFAFHQASDNQVENSAVVVDPLDGRVLAVGLDCTSKNPIRHAVMEAIDAVASGERQLAGETSGNDKRRKIGEVDDISEARRSSGNSLEETGIESERPYLCTGYEMYVIKEPCVMCSMALVHSRFLRVVYSIRDELQGALGSKWTLHGTQALNHKFHVYQLPLKDQEKPPDDNTF